MGVVHMEKSIHLEVNTRRILRFVAEGRHRKSARSVLDAQNTLSTSGADKPVTGLISYSYTVSYKWLTPAAALDPSRNSALAVPCPCGVGT